VNRTPDLQCDGASSLRGNHMARYEVFAASDTEGALAALCANQEDSA
jgi:hypothetical protein